MRPWGGGGGGHCFCGGRTFKLDQLLMKHLDRSGNIYILSFEISRINMLFVGKFIELAFPWLITMYVVEFHKTSSGWIIVLWSML